MRTVIAAFCLLFALPVTSEVTVLPPGTYGGAVIGSQAGNALGGFMSGVNDLRRIREEFNKEIAAARADFFARYPDGEGVEEAGQRLSALLAQKEMIVLNQSITRRMQVKLFGDAGMVGLLQDITDTTKDDFDGGIHPGAILPFQNYEYCVYETIESGLESILTNQKNFNTAHESAADDYQRYILIRNYIEFADAGISQAYFPSADSYIQFAILYTYGGYPRTDEQILDIHNTWVDTFGQDTLRRAADKLRKADLNFKLWPSEPEKLGIPTVSRMPLDSLLTLVARDASPKAYAIGVLRTKGYSRVNFDDGLAVYQAMVKKHGEAKVHQIARQVQAMPLAKVEHRVASGEYAGSTPRRVMFLMLPIEGDPGNERKQARYIARQKEMARQIAETKALVERKGIEKGRRFSEVHYDRFQKAYALAKGIDEQAREPKLADHVLVVAGMWNYYIKSVNYDYAGNKTSAETRSLFANMPNANREEMVKLIGFIGAHNRFKVKYLVPMEQIQQERIEAGKLAQADALDLTMTPDRRHILKWMDYEKKQYDPIQAKLDSNPSYELSPNDLGVAANYTRWQRWLEYDQSRSEPLPLGWTEADMLGKQHLYDMMAARDQAILTDHFKLEKYNKARDNCGLEPVERYPASEFLVIAAAGLWNEYLLSGDLETLYDSRKCILRAATHSIPARRFSSSCFGFLNNNYREELTPLMPTPPAAIQRRLLATGELSPEQAINFATDREIYAALHELYQKQHSFEVQVLRKSYVPKSKPELKEVHRQKVAKGLAEIEALKAKVDALDAANGQPSRFLTQRSPVIDRFIPKRAEPVDEVVKKDPVEPKRPDREERGGHDRSDKEELGDRGRGGRESPDEPVLEGEALGKAQLQAFLTALKKAEARDAAALKAINDERKAAGLEPVSGFTPATDLVQLVAGFWDAEITDDSSRGSLYASKTMSKLRTLDRVLHEQIEADLAVVFEDQPRDAAKPTALSAVQSANGGNELHLMASRDRDRLVRDLLSAIEDRIEAELKAANAKQASEKESAIRRAEIRVEKELEAEAEAREELAAYDKENTP